MGVAWRAGEGGAGHVCLVGVWGFRGFGLWYAEGRGIDAAIRPREWMSSGRVVQEGRGSAGSWGSWYPYTQCMTRDMQRQLPSQTVETTRSGPKIPTAKPNAPSLSRHSRGASGYDFPVIRPSRIVGDFQHSPASAPSFKCSRWVMMYCRLALMPALRRCAVHRRRRCETRYHPELERDSPISGNPHVR